MEWPPLPCTIITGVKRQALLNSFISWGGPSPCAQVTGESGKRKEERKGEGERSSVPGSPISSRPREAPTQRWGKGRRQRAREAGMCAAHGAPARPRVIDGARCRALLTQGHCSPSVKRSCRPLPSSWTFVQIPENRSWPATGKLRAVEGEEDGRAEDRDAPCSPRPSGNVGRWRLGHTDPKCQSSVTG